MVEESNFFAARLDSTRQKNYKMKVLKNRTKREFIDQYIDTNGKYTEELVKITSNYKLLKRGIMYTSYPELKEDVDLNDIISTFVEIKKDSEKDFIRFYESYTDKFEKGYTNEEIIKNAYRDLKTAYHTYRKCNTHGWKCPDEFITENEMRNLYQILTKNANKNSTNGIGNDEKGESGEER